VRMLAVFQHPMSPTRVIGGGERRFVEMCRCWRELGVQVDAIENPPYYAESFPFYNCLGVPMPFEAFPERRFTAHLKIWAGAVYTVSAAGRISRSSGYDLVYAHAPTVEDLLAGTMVSRELGVPLVVVHHHHYPSTERGLNLLDVYRDCRRVASPPSSAISAVEFFLIRSLGARARAHIAVSEFTRRQLLRMGFSPETIQVSGNGVDVARIDSFSGGDEPIYDGIYIGRISPVKGSLDLLEIWRLVVDEMPMARLVIVGGTKPYIEAEVRERLRKLGLEERVEIAGLVSEEVKFRLLKRSRVFVFPSLAEGWGLAPLEAMSCRLPVVCYDLPVLREVLGRAAVFAPLGNHRTFADVICSVLEDEGRRRQLGLQSRSIAEGYSWDVVAERELRFLERVAGV